MMSLDVARNDISDFLDDIMENDSQWLDDVSSKEISTILLKVF